GNANYLTKLPVRQAFQLAQHEQFTKAIWQVAHRPLEQSHAISSQRQCFRIEHWLSLAVLLLIERVSGRLQAVAAPANTRVANDSEKPGTPISSNECPKISKRSQRRLLHGIFCIRVVTHQPARQSISRIEVRKDHVLKCLPGRRQRRGAGKAVSRAAR